MLAACAGVSGCLGPKAVRYTRMRYNEVVRDTNDEQLLMNIVRLRYADSPVFIDLPNITSQFEVAGQGNYLGGYGNQEAGRTSLGFGELSLRDTPTSELPSARGAGDRQGAVDAAFVRPVHRGQRRGRHRAAPAADDQRHQRRAERPPVHDPDSQGPRRQHAVPRGIRLLDVAPARDGTELAFGTNEETDGASDPIPEGSVQGRDLLNAAHDGYVYRAKGNGQMTLLKREKDLVLKIRPAVRPLPRDGGSGADLPPDAGPEDVPDQVGADRGGQRRTRARSPLEGMTRST